MLALLLFLVVASVQHVGCAANATMGQLHVVSQSEFPLAAALDGSPPVYYVRPATTQKASLKWILYLDGGDFCGYGKTEAEQLEDCFTRSKTEYGSSLSYLKTPQVDMTQYSPLLNDSSTANPLANDWNWIVVPYLDGGYYAGRRKDTPVVNNSRLHFRGAFNVEAIVASLARMADFRGATDIVITGCSSGGVAVLANADHLHGLLHSVAQGARMSAFIDSGYYLHVDTKYWTEPPFRMQHLGDTLNAACMKSRSSSPWDCIVGEDVAPFVKDLPIFLAQSRYDTNQLECVNISESNVSGINAYGAQLLSSVHTWVSGKARAARSAFVDACSRHCSITSGIVTKDGVTAAIAFSSFHLRRAERAFIVQHGRYPCRECCNGGGEFEVIV